jgi:hypothetical protein
MGDSDTEFQLARACGICLGTVNMYTEFWWGNLKERDLLEDKCHKI